MRLSNRRNNSPLSRERSPSRRAMVALCAILCLGTAPVARSDDDAVRATAQRLIDRGRDIGLTSKSADGRRDAELILIWMTAAGRVDPAFGEAHRWTYQLAERLGRKDRAQTALRAYVELEPGNAVAALQLLEWELISLPTPDERIAHCEAQLARTMLPEVVGGHYHRMAEQHRLNGNLDAALIAARKAVEAFEFDIDARDLLDDLAGTAGSRRAHVERLLRRTEQRPDELEPLWDVARLLDKSALHTDARRWYRRAEAAAVRRQLAGPDPSTAPGALLVDMASGAFEAGDYGFALETCAAVDPTDPAYFSSRLLAIRAAESLNKYVIADFERGRMRDFFKLHESRMFETKDALTAARAAWFHLFADPDPHRAAKFSDFAYSLLPGEPSVRRVFGITRYRNGDVDTAERVLESLVDTDPWAAETYARIQIESGRRGEGIRILRRAESLRGIGQAHRRIVATLRSIGESPTPQPDASALRERIARFEESVLQFAEAPSHFLSLTAVPTTESVRYGEPIAFDLTLSNQAPFPITLGFDRMASPSVLVSLLASDDGAAPLTSADYLIVSMAKRLVLQPGERIHVRQTVDVGLARAAVQRDPLEEKEYTFTFLLDPRMQPDGQWTSRLTAMKPAVGMVIRRAAQYLETDGELERMRAVAAIVVPGQTGDAPRVGPTRTEALEDASPRVRAAAVAMLRHVELSSEIVNAAGIRLSDPDWLVRMETIELFAERHGPVFKPVLRRAAESDPDSLVRRLAALYLADLE